MSQSIHVINDAGYEGELESLCNAARAALQVCRAPEGEMTVVLADERQIRALNRQFLAQDLPTDVLAFPSGEIDPDSGMPYLGDVVVAVPVARQQALSRGHPVDQELALLVVHGTLHLLGYDHQGADEKQQMAERQRRALRKLGIPAIDLWED
jgi:probable rRNA maturation factor